MSGPRFSIHVEADAPAPLRVDLDRDEPFLVIDEDAQGAASRLVDILAGFAHPTSGTIRIAGTSLLDTARDHVTPPSRRAVGFIPGGVGLFPHLSVEENLAVGVRRSTAEVGERYQRAVHTFSLAPLLTFRPHDLVPREQLLGAVARAIIADAKWLLLERPDETLAADQDGIVDVMERIGEFNLPCVLTCRRDTAIPPRVGDADVARFGMG